MVSRKMAIGDKIAQIGLRLIAPMTMMMKQITVKITTSFLSISPLGICLLAVLAFFASISASITLLIALAPVLAPIKATKIQKIVATEGSPLAANNMAINAKDNEKMVCENITNVA